MAKKKPGAMIYHDDFMGYKEVLTYEQLGRLFVAILEYSADGVFPDFDDDRDLKIVWPSIKRSLERDTKQYEEKCTKSKYAAYCREADKAGRPRMTYEEWKKTVDFFDNG